MYVTDNYQYFQNKDNVGDAMAETENTGNSIGFIVQSDIATNGYYELDISPIGDI